MNSDVWAQFGGLAVIFGSVIALMSWMVRTSSNRLDKSHNDAMAFVRGMLDAHADREERRMDQTQQMIDEMRGLGRTIKDVKSAVDSIHRNGCEGQKKTRPRRRPAEA